MQTPIISVNGKIYDPNTAVISVLDRGYLFGDNVFEVFVGFGSKILDLSQHLARLRASAAQIELDIPWSDGELSFELLSIAEQAGFPKSNFRLVVSRGNGLGLSIPKDITPNKVIYAFPAEPVEASLQKNGIRLKKFDLGVTERGASVKTGNYLKSILAVKRAKELGFDDVLFSNSLGELTESSISNIFFIGRDGDEVDIVTPSLQSGLLRGITRGTVTNLLTSAKIPVEERVIFSDELARFDEAFLCSTVRGLLPVAAIDDHRLHSARPSSVFRKIEDLYLKWAASELGFKIDWNLGKI